MILVTGGTGLVGSHLLYALTAAGNRVRALKRAHSDLENVKKVFSFYTQNYAAQFNLIDWVEGDITDILSLQESLKGISYVYHSAAFISFDPRDKEFLMKINLEGTANVVNMCIDAGIKKLCYVSSIAAMGRNQSGLIDEETAWKTTKQNSNYARSKYLAEQEVWRASQEGLNVVIVNPTLIMGVHNWNNGTCRMFKEVDKGLRFYPPGGNGFVDVRDVVRSMIDLMKSDINAERFILNSENCTYKNLLELISKSLDKPSPSVAAKNWMLSILWRLEKIRASIFNKTPLLTKEAANASMRNTSYSNEKITKQLGQDFIPLSKTISEIGQFYKLHNIN